jgi:hypothetical protein
LGKILRGIFEERYIDHAVMTAQIEYRFPVWRRLAGALFAGAGDVAPGLGDWRFGGVRLAGGGGIRYAVNRAERMHVRFDLAVGNEETQVYFQFLEAF